MVTRLQDPPPTLPPDPPSWGWEPDMEMLRVFHAHPERDGMAPRTWGPIARFDPHIRDGHGAPRDAPDGRGVLYLARDLGTALAEAFPEQRPTVSICPRWWAVWARPTATVALLDLTGDGAMAIGAVGTPATGDEPRRRTQRWARRIHEQYRHLDGIRYRAAHQGGESVALWERAPRLTPVPGGASALWAVWGRVTVALASQGRVPRYLAEHGCRGCHDAGYV